MTLGDCYRLGQGGERYDTIRDTKKSMLSGTRDTPLGNHPGPLPKSAGDCVADYESKIGDDSYMRETAENYFRSRLLRSAIASP